jgi:F-type H+-transporting ATPase subunit gamma
MATARDIRRRIRTVRNIEQITNAMRMVAAARLRKAQERVLAARPYASQMRSLMQRLAGAAGAITHPLLQRHDGNRVALVVFSSDRGLCGSYNVNLGRLTLDFINERQPSEVSLFVVGKRGRDLLRRRGYPPTQSYPVPTDGTFAHIRPISLAVRSMYEQNQVDEVYLVFARFVSTMVQRPTVVQLLPVEPPVVAPEDQEQPLEYIFEPTPTQLLEHLLPRYVDTVLFQALLEAMASEFGARVTAMSNATNNASEMIEQLTLNLNRARQAAITKELAEIMGGVNALQKQ